MERMTERDMISELPNDLTNLVLERMPVQDAVRTSILCKNWRYKWTSIRNLTLGEEFFNHVGMDKSPQVYFEIVDDLLYQHDGNIDSFTLYVPDSDTEVSSALISILFLVSMKGVKQLNLYYDSPLETYKQEDYANLTSLYYCMQMTHLKMINCGIFRPPLFNGFPDLVFLHCESVNFSSGSFAHLFSTCPLIEELSLLDCHGPDTFDVCSTRLKHLKVSVASESVININTPNLEELYVCTREDDKLLDSRTVGIMTMLNSLKIFCFHCIFFDYLDDVSLFLGFLQAAPNLQVLDVTTAPGLHVEEAINILKTMNKKLGKLVIVNVHIWDGGDEEMFLIELLLSLTPSLKKMHVELQYVGNTVAITDEIEEFSRASPVAEIDFQVSGDHGAPDI